MFNTIKKVSAALVFTIATISTASATPVLNVQNGILMGASNVLVNGNYYTVKFVDGSYNSLFPNGLAGNPFNTDALAIAARDALSTVFTGIYDTSPALTNGCIGGTFCSVETPYSATSTNVAIEYIANFSGMTSNSSGFVSLPINTDTTSSPNTTFAVWSTGGTPAATNVPEPGTPVLLGLGLVALMARRRRAAK